MTPSHYAGPDGTIHHAQVGIGDSVVEMGEAHGSYQPRPTMFYFYVKGCDAGYARAVRAGATSLSELSDQAYGDRSGSVEGPVWQSLVHRHAH